MKISTERWVKVSDCEVRHVWKSEYHEEESEREQTEVEPGFYQDCGTPIDEEGDDMRYSHTEVRAPKSFEQLEKMLRAFYPGFRFTATPTSLLIEQPL